MTIVSSVEFQRNVGFYEAKALAEPVRITKNGREHLVLLSADEFHRRERRDRRVFAVEDLSEEQIAALKDARVPARYAHLDAELEDWTP